MFPRRLLLGFLFSLSALVFLMAATSSAGPRPQIQAPFRLVIDPGHGGSNMGCIFLVLNLFQYPLKSLLLLSNRFLFNLRKHKRGCHFYP